MGTKAAITRNMPKDFRAFYEKNIGFIKDAIAEYFPRRVDRAVFEEATGLPELYPQDTQALYDAIYLPTQQYLDRGGKVLRPILVAICLEAYGADPKRFKPVFGAIEAMEDSSIMMDDYIDNSLERRGGPCAHVVHGYPLANISSCTAFAIVHQLFYNNDLGLSEEKTARLLNALAWERIQMSFGQIIELYWTESNVNDVTVDQYLQETIARCAFLTFRGPLHYAGLLADAPEADIPHLRRIGEYLLVGYHLKGDNMDISPESGQWGKLAGEDITTGRRTILINYLLQNAPADQRKALEAILNSRTEDERIKRSVYEMMLEHRVFAYTAKLAEKYNRRAKREIDRLQIPDRSKALLHQFSDFATRKRTI
jgi:octaprenyl-diphosphate synthase